MWRKDAKAVCQGVVAGLGLGWGSVVLIHLSERLLLAHQPAAIPVTRFGCALWPSHLLMLPPEAAGVLKRMD